MPPTLDSAIAPAVINIATIARHAIVAAVAGKRIYVYAIWLWSTGTNTATFESATTALAGGVDLVAQSNFVLDFNRATEPWFTTTAGEAFNISLSAAVQVSGIAYYRQQ